MMEPMWKRPWFKILVLVLVILAGAFWWLVLESDLPTDRNFTLDIAELRQLANSMPGSKPTEIRVEQVASFRFPAAALMAGDSWTMQSMPASSYQLIYPDRTIIIDSAMNQEQAKAMGTTNGFDSAAYDRMSQGMRSASMILITHEHPDHLGGVAAIAAQPGVMQALRLTREQVVNIEGAKPVVFPPSTLSGYQPLAYDRVLAVAPGVVLIKSPGHTPGSQIVFVRTANRNEIFFLGDVAWHLRNVEWVRERPRLLTMAMKEDRNQVMEELVALHELSQADPKIYFVPGHDGEVIADLIQQKVLIRGFK
jgi:glyoxylase-like metal-dependent hydrolase (beta-lactamase superfamily II)